MKLFIGFLLALCLVACTEEPTKVVARPTLVPKDSILSKTDSINPYAPIDVSPMDMSYFPVNYPIEKMSGKTTAPPVARVIYSRPHRQGRTIFGALVKYGEPWRLGANEATEIEFFQSVTIQNRRIPKGKYVLYAIPQQDKWTIVFNTNLNTWGLRQDEKDDVFRFDVPVQTATTPIEYYSMVFESESGGAALVMAWDKVVARMSFQF